MPYIKPGKYKYNIKQSIDIELLRVEDFGNIGKTFPGMFEISVCQFQGDKEVIYFHAVYVYVLLPRLQ